MIIRKNTFNTLHLISSCAIISQEHEIIFVFKRKRKEKALVQKTFSFLVWGLVKVRELSSHVVEAFQGADKL